MMETINRKNCGTIAEQDAENQPLSAEKLEEVSGGRKDQPISPFKPVPPMPEDGPVHNRP